MKDRKKQDADPGPLPLPVSEPQVSQPMPPEMLPVRFDSFDAPSLGAVILGLRDLRKDIRQALRNQALLLRLALTASPSGGTMQREVWAAVAATDELLGGKP